MQLIRYLGDAFAGGAQLKFGLTHQEVGQPEMERLSGAHLEGAHQVFVRYAEAVGIKGSRMFFLIIRMQETEKPVCQFVRTGCRVCGGRASIETAHFDNKRK